MSLRLVALATLASSALLCACGPEDDLITSETSDPTSDQGTIPPEVDTDPPPFGDTDTNTDTDTEI